MPNPFDDLITALKANRESTRAEPLQAAIDTATAGLKSTWNRPYLAASGAGSAGIAFISDNFMYPNTAGGLVGVDTIWTRILGTDPQSTILPAEIGNGGLAMTFGDDPLGTLATNGAQLSSGLMFRASASGIRTIGAVSCGFFTSTNAAFFVGFTDQRAALEMPFTLGPGNVLTSNASNAYGFLYDSAADTDTFWGVGVANDVDAAAQQFPFAPQATRNQALRVECDLVNLSANFFIDDNPIGQTMNNCVGNNVDMCFVVVGFSRAAATRTLSLDYAYAERGPGPSS